MTIAICHVEPHRVLLASDTRDSGGRDVDKLLSLPRAEMVISYRGLSHYFAAVFEVFHLNALRFDGIEDHAQEVFSVARQMILTARQADAPGASVAGQFFVAGWSDRGKRMRATVYIVSDDGALATNEVDPQTVAGAEESWGPMPNYDFSTHANIEAVARWQVGHWRRDGTAVELTRGRTVITMQCDFGL